MSALLSPSAAVSTPPARRPGKLHAVLRAAGELFLAEGYAAVSMDMVAKKAGVSKATLYAHMPSKEALFGEVVARRCNEMTTGITRVAGHDLPLRDAMQRLGRYWLTFVLSPESLSVFRTVLAEGVRFPDLARSFYEGGPARSKAHIREWMAEEQRRGRLRADLDPRLAASQFIALIRGELYMRVALGMATDPTEAELAGAVEPVVELLLRAWATPEALQAAPAPSA
ncbi:MAG TPA: TetR/AcrR family transcriptional regulator [Roseomonas sp.]|jgi:TetR/AcrR family transcriptional repressor of mexJK operon